jgi:hypothetical protein
VTNPCPRERQPPHELSSSSVGMHSNPLASQVVIWWRSLSVAVDRSEPGAGTGQAVAPSGQRKDGRKVLATDEAGLLLLVRFALAGGLGRAFGRSFAADAHPARGLRSSSALAGGKLVGRPSRGGDERDE